MCSTQQWHKGLVISLNGELDSQNVIGKLFAGPHCCECLLLLKTNLLGLPAIIDLNLIARLDATTDYDSLVKTSFPPYFKD